MFKSLFKNKSKSSNKINDLSDEDIINFNKNWINNSTDKSQIKNLQEKLNDLFDTKLKRIWF